MNTKPTTLLPTWESNPVDDLFTDPKIDTDHDGDWIEQQVDDLADAVIEMRIANIRNYIQFAIVAALLITVAAGLGYLMWTVINFDTLSVVQSLHR